MRRRVLSGLLAAVLAIAAAAAADAAVKQARATAVAGLQPVTVLIAQRDIPAGTRAGAALASGFLRDEQYPRASVPPGALAALTAATSGLLTDASLSPGSILTRATLGGRARTTSGLPVPSGLIVVTVQVCTAQAVAGYVQAGSHVAVYSAAGSCGTSQAGARAHLVIARVLVLATGLAPAIAPPPAGIGSSSQQSATILITLAVAPADVPAVMALGESAYLALLTGQVTPQPSTASSKRG